MTYEELVRLITESGSDDWTQLEPISTFKRDLNVRVVDHGPDDATPCEEPWATNFPDRQATTSLYQLFYGSSLVYELVMASVDGARATLPFPVSRDNLIVTPLKYAMACAVNRDQERLDQYMNRAGLAVAG